MSSQFASQIQFVSALALVLVTGAALFGVITARAGELLGSAVRAVLGAGLVAVGAAAFARGAFLGDGLALVGAVGSGAVAAAAWRLRPRATGRLVEAAAICGIMAAVVRYGGASVAGDGIDMLTAALGVAALVPLSSRALSTQITAAVGGVAVGAVVALATIVSVGVGGDLRAVAVRQLATRLEFESALVDHVASDTLAAADSAARGQLLAEQSGRLAVAEGSKPDPVISAALAESRYRTPAVALAFVTEGGTVVGQSGFDGTVPHEVVSAVAALGAASPRGRAELRRSGDRIVALGSMPVVVAGRPAGVVVAVTGLRDHLASRSTGGIVVDAELPDRTGRASAILAALTRRAVVARGRVTETSGNALFAARPLGAAGQTPIAVLIVRAPVTALAASQHSLLRWLFILAIASALGVAGACVGLGARIGARLARLTVATQRLQRGDLTARAGIPGDDAVARLGGAFDEMAASLEVTRDDLVESVTRESSLRERLASVVGGIQEAVLAVDAEGRITDVNQSAETLLDIGRDSATGQLLSDVVRLRPPDVISAVLHNARHAGEPVRRSRAVLGSHDVPVEISAATIGERGRSEGAVIVMRDLRPELDAERAKNEVVQRVSHELRTPLTPIKGWSTLLGRRDLPAKEAAEIGRALLSSSARLERSVEQLIFMATSYGGEGEMHLEALSPGELVTEATRDWKASTPAATHVVARCRTGLPPITADRRWMRQALQELLDNAVKFSPEDAAIFVEARPGPGPGEVSLVVSDKGVGLGDELAGLLAAFQQGDGSDTRHHEGLGLGLTIVDRVARAHRGRVEATPRRSGVTMSLVIPAANGRRRTRTRAPEPSRHRTPERRKTPASPRRSLGENPS